MALGSTRFCQMAQVRPRKRYLKKFVWAKQSSSLDGQSTMLTFASGKHERSRETLRFRREAETLAWRHKRSWERLLVSTWVRPTQLSQSWKARSPKSSPTKKAGGLPL